MSISAANKLYLSQIASCIIVHFYIHNMYINVQLVVVVTVRVPGPRGNALDPELDICSYSGEYIRVAVETVHSNHRVSRYICLSVKYNL